METHDLTDPENVKIGHRDPRPPHRILKVAEAFDRFKPEWEQAHDYVMEVIGKVTPVGLFMTCGHVVEDPLPQGGFLEDSFKPGWDPFADRKDPTKT